MPGPRVSVYTPLGQVKIEYDSCPIFHFLPYLNPRYLTPEAATWSGETYRSDEATSSGQAIMSYPFRFRTTPNASRSRIKAHGIANRPTTIRSPTIQAISAR